MEQGKTKGTMWELYMYLLRCAIHNDKIQKEELDRFEKITMEELIDTIALQDQVMLLYQHAEAYHRYLEGKEDIYAGINGLVVLKLTMREYEKYQILRRVIEKCKESNLTIVLFKGVVLADLYPQYIHRRSCDTDIYIDKSNVEQVKRVFESLGYHIVVEQCKSEVAVYYHEQYQHKIELHTCLWEDFTGTRMDILSSFQLTDPTHLIRINACGMDITTLGYTDHLVYQIFHVIKHFSLEGVGCKYLADITLYINRYGDKIDYREFWKKMDRLGYSKFVFYFFTICIEFLGMHKDCLLERQYRMGEEFELFVSDLMQIGNRSDTKEASWQILGMMTPYFVGGKKGEKNAFRRKMQVIFPRPKDLPDDLAYAKKVCILLPIAWIHKAVRYFLKLRKHKNDWYNPSEKLEVAERRIALMTDLGLLDE